MDIVELLRSLMEGIVKNTILKDNSPYFALRKKTLSQLDFLKQQFKTSQEERSAAMKDDSDEDNDDDVALVRGLDHDSMKEKFPALRFSEEVYVLVNILLGSLRKLPC